MYRVFVHEPQIDDIVSHHIYLYIYNNRPKRVR
jgi:hypothetical protein